MKKKINSEIAKKVLKTQLNVGFAIVFMLKEKLK